MAFQWQAFLNHWYRHGGNRAALSAVEALLADQVTHLFGFYLVQLGAPWPHDVFEHSPIDTRVLCAERPQRFDDMETVVADLDYLPFGRESLDAVVLPHTLEAVDDPYHLLRQVDNMLVLDGHVIIVGFNPLSLRNQRLRWFGRDRAVFRRANWLRMHRVIDWLNLLGYEIKLAQHTLIRRPTGSNVPRVQERLEYALEKGALHPGRLYAIVAQKRSAPLTPVGLNWKLANWLPVNKGAWVPSRRVGHAWHRRTQQS
ncbi:methyltransferase domain-containing protein [Sulfurivirga sp.]|uniref:class I SAM-dependent methyltransferase n=1 Tax=Sulfurivirga sp. TaxID=2614236 RepID=UPI0025F0C552|nr:methyltransferase domain-containing protein [Sulfurivirga sp.]